MITEHDLFLQGLHTEMFGYNFPNILVLELYVEFKFMIYITLMYLSAGQL